MPEARTHSAIHYNHVDLHIVSMCLSMCVVGVSGFCMLPVCMSCVSACLCSCAPLSLCVSTCCLCVCVCLILCLAAVAGQVVVASPPLGCGGGVRLNNILTVGVVVVVVVAVPV